MDHIQSYYVPIYKHLSCLWPGKIMDFGGLGHLFCGGTDDKRGNLHANVLYGAVLERDHMLRSCNAGTISVSALIQKLFRHNGFGWAAAVGLGVVLFMSGMRECDNTNNVGYISCGSKVVQSTCHSSRPLLDYCSNGSSKIS